MNSQLPENQQRLIDFLAIANTRHPGKHFQAFPLHINFRIEREEFNELLEGGVIERLEEGKIYSLYTEYIHIRITPHGASLATSSEDWTGFEFESGGQRYAVIGLSALWIEPPYWWDAQRADGGIRSFPVKELREFRQKAAEDGQ